jgi:hypothetical protein
MAVCFVVYVKLRTFNRSASFYKALLHYTDTDTHTHFYDPSNRNP